MHFPDNAVAYTFPKNAYTMTQSGKLYDFPRRGQLIASKCVSREDIDDTFDFEPDHVIVVGVKDGSWFKPFLEITP